MFINLFQKKLLYIYIVYNQFMKTSLIKFNILISSM